MFEIFYPSLTVDSIKDITRDILEKYRIKGLILDIDNTLAPNYTAIADEKTVKWIDTMKKAGYKLTIVSNASKNRVIRFNNNLKLHAVHRAFKPGTCAFKKVKKIMGLKNKEIAVVGDQIFTDIYGGNLAGMYTILVKPINSCEGRFVKLKRFFEKIVLKQYKNSCNN